MTTPFKRIVFLVSSFFFPILTFYLIQIAVIKPLKPACRYNLYNETETRSIFENEWKLFKEDQKEREKYSDVRKRNILILTIVEGGSNLTEYTKAQATVECYAKIQGYTRKFIYDTEYGDFCHQVDKFFRRHCIAAILLNDFDYLLFLDADSGIINPARRIEEYIDDRYDIFLYDRIFNQEIAAGSYIVKNTAYAKKFLNEFANRENTLYFNSIHGTDNGALHLYLAEIFFGRGNEGTRICTDVYKNSRDFDGLFGFEVCIRGVLGRWSHFDKVKIFRKGTGWIRDSWATNSIWSPRRDFFLHDWKQHNMANYTHCELPIDITYRYHGRLHFPLNGEINLDLCVPGNTTWNYDYNLVRAADDINAEISRREYFIEQERYKLFRYIPGMLGF